MGAACHIKCQSFTVVQVQGRPCGTIIDFVKRCVHYQFTTLAVLCTSPHHFAANGLASVYAQVLFASTPIWSTVVAVAVLHEAQPSGLEILGGALILTASLLATREKA